MADIKLFVCCHRPEKVPKYPPLYPIQVGTVLSEVRFPGFLYDNTGENISEKNRFYCELTAQLWAWMIVQADYYGFFHYRRYLYPDAKAKRPYLIRGAPSIELLESLRFSSLEELIPQYDLILPKRENMYLSVREHYAKAPYHHGWNLERAVEILLKNHPEYRGAAEQYLSGSGCYFGNIFIARREIFHDYCSWLFPILSEFDRLPDTSGYSAQEQRVDGYLAERLLGIWAVAHTELQTLELPRVHFYSGLEYIRQYLLSVLLPPGSWQRYTVKQSLISLKRVSSR